MDAFEKLEKVGEGAYDKVYIAREKSCWVCSVAMPISSIKLIDVKQGISKTRDMVLYLVFEYMDTDLKKFIRSFRQTRENIHLPTVKGYDDIPKKIQDADVKKDKIEKSWVVIYEDQLKMFMACYYKDDHMLLEVDVK
ncbi:cyclin-dependent kinase B2-1 isoform X2 [Daucus carota subsp. sativus]|uniref:cyclin-dependent kinase B2-1 isoform X2 n=1 Tax=Daucus carota subsp. sativus TaxID=79200 RepID=UPI0007B206A9|nr:PREDICTED: cyclin-dependent kinase B2-1-like isoform X2 [Daucus carota subsp. sativus]